MSFFSAVLQYIQNWRQKNIIFYTRTTTQLAQPRIIQLNSEKRSMFLILILFLCCVSCCWFFAFHCCFAILHILYIYHFIWYVYIHTFSVLWGTSRCLFPTYDYFVRSNILFEKCCWMDFCFFHIKKYIYRYTNFLIFCFFVIHFSQFFMCVDLFFFIYFLPHSAKLQGESVGKSFEFWKLVILCALFSATGSCGVNLSDFWGFFWWEIAMIRVWMIYI